MGQESNVDPQYLFLIKAMLLSVWPMNGMFLFVLSSEPLTPFYFVFLFIGVLRRLCAHLAPHLLRMQKYSTVYELPGLVLLFLKVGLPQRQQLPIFSDYINMHVHCWEIKTKWKLWKNTKVSWNLALRQPLVVLSANMAALHCFRKHGPSLFSLPLLLLGRDKDKVLGSLAGRALTEWLKATAAYKYETVTWVVLKKVSFRSLEWTQAASDAFGDLPIDRLETCFFLI